MEKGFTKMNKPKSQGPQAGSVKDKNVGKLTIIRKKIDQLRVLMRPESKNFRERIPKTLEFGHEFTTTYKRHTAGGHVKDIFQNPHLRSFVSYNEKQLHVWKESNGQQVQSINFFDETQSHSISCIVYSKSHMLYLAISTDFKLHIFNAHLILIGWLPLKVRLVNFAYFYEEKSLLITGGIDGCHMFKFEVTSKYDPKQACLLDPEGQFFNASLGPKIKMEKMPLWIKGLKVNTSQNVIFSWSQLKVCFNDLDGKILFRYKKLTSYEDCITDIFVSEKYKYFVTSTLSGSIIVWKLQKAKDLIHTFIGHTKSVTSLMEIPERPTLFISASNDNTIRIFSLDKFTELYRFILPAGVANINLLSSKIFACFYNDQINIGQLHHLALNFYSSKIEVKKIVKIFKNAKEKSWNRSDIVMTLFSDNSVQLQSSNREDPTIISTIFPPPGAKEVKFLNYCMNTNRIFIVLESGSICIYRIDDQNLTILEQMLHQNQIKDSFNRNFNQQITSVTFCSTIPPKFDIEIYNEDTKITSEWQDKYGSDLIDRFLVLGTSKGMVLFLEVDNIENIYARFFFHRQAITHIQEIPNHQKFVTVCAEMNICVWGFKDNRSYILSFNQMYRPIDQIICSNDSVLVGFSSGDIQLFRYDSEYKDLAFIKQEFTLEHEKKITDFACFQERNLFISGSLDGYAKIWNSKKDLIREIKFPEPVYSVDFQNATGDILVGHHGKVSMVTAQDYGLNELVREVDDAYFERKKIRVSSELFEKLKEKDDELKKQNMILLNSKVQKPAKVVISSQSPQKKQEKQLEILSESEEYSEAGNVTLGSFSSQEIMSTIETARKVQQEALVPSIDIKVQTTESPEPIKLSNESSKTRIQSNPVTIGKHTLQNYRLPPVTIEEPELKPYENYHSYNTAAIPRKQTELNYNYAINRMMHQKNKKTLQTRRDMTIRQIQNNISTHNDPIGEGLVFDQLMIGQKSEMAQSSKAPIFSKKFVMKRNSQTEISFEKQMVIERNTQSLSQLKMQPKYLSSTQSKDQLDVIRNTSADFVRINSIDYIHATIPEPQKQSSLVSLYNDGSVKQNSAQRLPKIDKNSLQNFKKYSNIQLPIPQMKMTQEELHGILHRPKNSDVTIVPVKRNLVAKKNQKFHIKETQQNSHMRFLQEDSLFLDEFDSALKSTVQGIALSPIKGTRDNSIIGPSTSTNDPEGSRKNYASTLPTHLNSLDLPGNRYLTPFREAKSVLKIESKGLKPLSYKLNPILKNPTNNSATKLQNIGYLSQGGSHWRNSNFQEISVSIMKPSISRPEKVFPLKNQTEKLNQIAIESVKMKLNKQNKFGIQIYRERGLGSQTLSGTARNETEVTIE